MMQMDYCFLDKVRIGHGINKCKAVFLEVYKNDSWKAISFLNDPRLTFPCLFIFPQIIDVLGIHSFLNARNISALNIMSQVQERYRYNYGESPLSTYNWTEYPIYKWILETGYADDGLDDEYEAIMDTAVSVLITVYKDNSILPVVADMIFRRNRNGHYTHDLLWAFFQSSVPEALKLTAERICSSNQQDVDLAYHLLHFDASLSSLNILDRQSKLQAYLQWLNENAPFLYFTGESFQYSSNPVLYKVAKAEGEGAK
jgi:hypothetical protein